jgi:hypothetical protein
LRLFEFFMVKTALRDHVPRCKHCSPAIACCKQRLSLFHILREKSHFGRDASAARVSSLTQCKKCGVGAYRLSCPAQHFCFDNTVA